MIYTKFKSLHQVQIAGSCFLTGPYFVLTSVVDRQMRHCFLVGLCLRVLVDNHSAYPQVSPMISGGTVFAFWLPRLLSPVTVCFRSINKSPFYALHTIYERTRRQRLSGGGGSNLAMCIVPVRLNGMEV